MEISYDATPFTIPYGNIYPIVQTILYYKMSCHTVRVISCHTLPKFTKKYVRIMTKWYHAKRKKNILLRFGLSVLNLYHFILPDTMTLCTIPYFTRPYNIMIYHTITCHVMTCLTKTIYTMPDTTETENQVIYIFQYCKDVTGKYMVHRDMPLLYTLTQLLVIRSLDFLQRL